MFKSDNIEMEVLKSYSNDHPKFLVANLRDGFFSINYIQQIQCLSQDCNKITSLAPFCPDHTELIYRVRIGPSQIGKNSRGLFASRAKEGAPFGSLIAFQKGDLVCLYGQKGINDFYREPQTKDQVTRILRDLVINIYGRKGCNIYSFETDDRKITYDCALIRYPGAYVNDAEAAGTSYQVPGLTHNVRFEYNDQGCWLEAIRDIMVDEEILAEYGPAYWLSQTMGPHYRFEDSVEIPEWFAKSFLEAELSKGISELTINGVRCCL